MPAIKRAFFRLVKVMHVTEKYRDIRTGAKSTDPGRRQLSFAINSQLLLILISAARRVASFALTARRWSVPGFRSYTLTYLGLMPAASERCRATDPIVGVLYVEGIHGDILLMAGFIYSDRSAAGGPG